MNFPILLSFHNNEYNFILSKVSTATHPVLLHTQLIGSVRNVRHDVSIAGSSIHTRKKGIFICCLLRLLTSSNKVSLYLQTFTILAFTVIADALCIVFSKKSAAYISHPPRKDVAPLLYKLIRLGLAIGPNMSRAEAIVFFKIRNTF